jgi:hypothetical protein
MYNKMQTKVVFILSLFFITTTIDSAAKKPDTVSIFQTRYAKILKKFTTQEDRENQLKELLAEIDTLLNVMQKPFSWEFLVLMMSGGLIPLTLGCSAELITNYMSYTLNDIIFNIIQKNASSITYEDIVNENSEIYKNAKKEYFKSRNPSEAEAFDVLSKNLSKEEFEQSKINFLSETSHEHKLTQQNLSMNMLKYGTASVLGVIILLKAYNWLVQNADQIKELRKLKKEIQTKLDALS